MKEMCDMLKGKRSEEVLRKRQRGERGGERDSELKRMYTKFLTVENHLSAPIFSV